MYAHERSLVEKYQGKPFALLGVNTDPLDTVKDIYKQQNITWRSWVAGGTDGRIPATWGIELWPTIFLIDHQGTIRHKFSSITPAKLDQLIEELMSAAKAGEDG